MKATHRHYKLAEKVLQAICVLFFTIMLGFVGGVDHDTIGLWAGFFGAAGSMAVSVFFGWLSWEVGQHDED